MTAEQAQLLGEINERTKMIVERLPAFASCDHVDALEARLDDHIQKGRFTVGNVIGGIAGAGGLIAGLAAFLHRGL
jgi:hypothetical protein